MQLFNFHTHNISEDFGIINVHADFPFDLNKQYSIGIHPWDYSDNLDEVIQQITNAAALKSVVAIGETGFDPKSKVYLDVQKTIFKKHIELSELLQKPMIIHCVKYYNELIEIKKTMSPKQAWIIHGFRGKLSILEDLIKHDFYFSINDDILKDPLKAEKTLQLIGTKRLFLETDNKNTDIRNIYNFAAKIFNYKIEELVSIIGKNLLKCKI